MYARSRSPSRRPAPTTVASRSPVPARSLLLYELALLDGNICSPKWLRGNRTWPKTLLFENARYLKSLIRSHFLRPFHFDLSDRLHNRTNSLDPYAHHRQTELGILVSKDLKLDHHNEIACSKALCVIFLWKRGSPKQSLATKLNLYMSMVVPSLFYVSACWCNNVSITKCDRARTSC